MAGPVGPSFDGSLLWHMVQLMRYSFLPRSALGPFTVSLSLLGSPEQAASEMSERKTETRKRIVRYRKSTRKNLPYPMAQGNSEGFLNSQKSKAISSYLIGTGLFS